MRDRIIGWAALVALALGIGSSVWVHRDGPAPRVAAPLAVAAVAVVPAPAPAAAPPPPPVAQLPADPPAPPSPKEPDLPTVAVAQHNVHTIDDSAALPVPTVTLHQKDGRVIVHAAALEPTPRPVPPRSPAAAPPVSAKFAVAGLPVHLFGVRPPDPRDRCGHGTASACSDGARAAVAARLGAAGNVKCTVPPGQQGDPGFVCRDGAGIDLGGLLVAQGLALADTSSSYNYLGAETEARKSRRGLWAYR